uniref:T9SS type A sorting domain-containing protein n=1 Tax=Rhodothermus marinus TaxID=29549 RepID=A0A7V2B0Y0_RHOMR
MHRWLRLWIGLWGLSFGAVPVLFAQEAIPLANPSFEQAPDGSTPCVRETDWERIPGWNMDAPAEDSGVSENTNATDGTCAAWLASRDPAIWQLTDYVIQENDVLTLYVDLRNSWMAWLVQIAIIYEFNGERRVAAADTVEVFDVMDTYSVSFTASELPEAIGHRVGVAIDNIDSDPNTFVEIDNVRLFRSTATASETVVGRPEGLVLEAGYPNPFGRQTTLAIALSRPTRVHLAVYALTGQEVARLVDGLLPAGRHEVVWRPGRLSTGVYLVRLEADGAVLSRLVSYRP